MLHLFEHNVTDMNLWNTLKYTFGRICDAKKIYKKITGSHNNFVPLCCCSNNVVALNNV